LLAAACMAHRPLVLPVLITFLGMGCDMDIHTYDDDPSHAIPRVGVINVVVPSDQALRYGLVIATPLDSSERSLKRLQRKCDNYLADFRSPETRADLSNRGNGSKYIHVYLHPASSPEARDIVRACQLTAESEGITFTVTESSTGSDQ
jgi:hypothetical protein